MEGLLSTWPTPFSFNVTLFFNALSNKRKVLYVKPGLDKSLYPDKGPSSLQSTLTPFLQLLSGYSLIQVSLGHP